MNKLLSNKYVGSFSLLMLIMATIGGAYLSISEWLRITNAAVAQEPFIEFQNFFSLYMIGLVFPLSLMTIIVNTIGGKIAKKRGKIHNSHWGRYFIIILLFVLTSMFYIEFSAYSKLESNNYTYCESMSTHLGRSLFKMYVKEPSLCVD